MIAYGFKRNFPRDEKERKGKNYKRFFPPYEFCVILVFSLVTVIIFCSLLTQNQIIVIGANKEFKVNPGRKNTNISDTNEHDKIPPGTYNRSVTPREYYRSHSLTFMPTIFCSMNTNDILQIKLSIETWGRFCSKIVGFSNVESEHTVRIGSYDSRWEKQRNILKYVHEHFNTYDYYIFITANNTFWHIPNFQNYIINEKLKDGEALYLGRLFTDFGVDYHSGGGYIFNHHALSVWHTKCENYEMDIETFNEDLQVALCLKENGVLPYNTADDFGRERFHPFCMECFSDDTVLNKPMLYLNEITFRSYFNSYYKLKYKQKPWPDCCSPWPILFHAYNDGWTGSYFNHFFPDQKCSIELEMTGWTGYTTTADLKIAGIGNDIVQIVEMILEAEENDEVCSVSYEEANKVRSEQGYTDSLSEIFPLMKDARVQIRQAWGYDKQQTMHYGTRYNHTGDVWVQGLINSIDYERVLRSYILPQMKPEIPEQTIKDTLVIYLRNGDAADRLTKWNWFPEWQDKNFTKYLFDVIEKSGLPKIEIVKKIGKNIEPHPSFKHLEQNYDIIVKNRTLKEDLSVLMNCEHLVLDFSTFAYTAALMNKKLKHVYIPWIHGIKTNLTDDIGYTIPPTETRTVHLISPKGKWVTKRIKDGDMIFIEEDSNCCRR